MRSASALSARDYYQIAKQHCKVVGRRGNEYAVVGLEHEVAVRRDCAAVAQHRAHQHAAFDYAAQMQ